LQVGQRIYYQWKSQSVSDRKQGHGSPRMAARLTSLGNNGSRVTVAKYMNQLGLKSKLSKKLKVTTNSKHKYLIVPTVLKRESSVTKPSKAWCRTLLIFE